MEATVTQSEIFLGEAAFLTLQVHNYQPGLGQPDLSALPADIDLLGQQDQSHQSIQIVNGVQQVTSFSGRTFTYRVQPRAAGTFRFAPMLLRRPDGQPLPVNTPTLLVRPIPVQDHVRIRVIAPQHDLMLDESFEVTLLLEIRKPPQPFQSYSPIPNGTTPHLQIPYLDLQPTQGLQSENITQLLQRMVVSEGEAFRINDRVIGRDPFAGMFGRDQAARFQLPRTTSRADDKYYQYTLTSRWSADREGTYTFGPVRFRGSVITAVSPQGQATREDIYALGPAATVRVQPPPAEGRPATFAGASGAGYRMETTLDTQVCQTGDPVTLTLTITGKGPVQRILSPRPATLAPLESDFRVQPEPSSSETIPDGRRFSYLIRPRRDGTLEIPALEMAYFDLDTRSYRIVTSDPLPIRVNPGPELPPDALPEATSGRIRIGSAAAPGDLPPAPFRMTPPEPAPIFRPAWHGTLALAGPLFLLFSLLARQLPRHLPALQARIRHRQAYTQALDALRSETSDPRDPVWVLRDYLHTRLGDAFQKGQRENMEKILQEHGIDATTRASLVTLLTESAYAGTPDNAPARHAGIRALLEQVERQIHPARSRRHGKVHARILLLLVTAFAASNLAHTISSFEQRRTNLLLLQAKDTTGFLQAAAALADQVDQGNRSPQVLYNLGTALLLGEQPAIALPLLQWAERRGVDAWSVRRNMLVARRMLAQDPALQLPWIRKLLFWHYRLPLPTRMTLLAILWSLLWIAGTLRWYWKRPVRTILPVLITMALLAASVLASLYAELQNEQIWPTQSKQIERILAHQQEDIP